MKAIAKRFKKARTDPKIPQSSCRSWPQDSGLVSNIGQARKYQAYGAATDGLTRRISGDNKLNIWLLQRREVKRVTALRRV